ncbi:hypothetical protein OKA05_16750 [Luteolibacter arcticus]|uniref:Lipoprotein n=1 Tax=Luteolibacter arcticus TaxID=1581411 RepID=A0ABT3GL19_9BACT|nr:hypothetical protein [Luteolibacter arcticus]MCW1924218.1 hypothetical protein [Luteolibacter arcticus]
MKLLPPPGRFLLPALLAFVLAACDGRKEVVQGQVAEADVAELSTPSESAERRRVRELLEGVVIPRLDFENISAEECADYVAFRIKEIAPAKAVKIVVRRPMPIDEEGRPILRGQFCYGGHTWKAESISAWQVLERIASDNRMSVEVDEMRVQLMPLPVDGEPMALLRPLEED